MNSNGQMQNQAFSGNAHQFIEYAMTNYIMTTMSKLADKEFSFSIVGTILIILSLSELKGILIDFLKSTSTYLKENYKTIFLKIIELIKLQTLKNILYLYTYGIFLKIMHIFKKNSEVPEKDIIINKQPNETLYSCTYDFKYTVQFMQNLLNYIEKNKKNCQYNVNNEKKIEIVNLEETLITETWSGINIKFKDYHFNFLNAVSLKFIKKNDKISLVGSENCYNDPSNVQTFSDLLPNSDIKIFIKNIISEEEINKIKIDNEITNIDIKLCEESLGTITVENKFLIDKKKGFEYNFICLLKSAIPNLNFITSYYEFIIFTQLLIYLANDNSNLADYNNIYNILNNYIKKNNNLIVFDYNIQLDKSKIQELQNCPIDYNKSLFYSKINIENLRGEYEDECEGDLDSDNIECYENYIINLKSNKNKDSDMNSESIDLKVNIICRNQIIDKDIYDFIDEVNEYSFVNMKTNNKIKIFNVTMDKKTVVEEEENPEYNEYMEKYNLLFNATNSKDNNNDNKQAKNSSFDFEKNFMFNSFSQIPSKKIKSEKVVKKIQCDYINEKNKGFDTLYLREKDTKKLKFALENFNNRIELLEELGLPNKLGILLYGEPGTGKTSTIWAIATYLKKNIYYINLNTIESNEELQMVFDFVNKNCVNGGIICFEDIDAMTKIVHKRKAKNKSAEKISENIANITQNKKDKLTLEYILNVLQGTLTQDGTTFIVTTNHLEHLDPAFYRDGRFDVKIEMKKCDKYQIQNIYERFIKRKLDEDLLNQIPEDRYTPANIIFHLKDYILSDCSDREIINSLISSQ